MISTLLFVFLSAFAYSQPTSSETEQARLAFLIAFWNPEIKSEVARCSLIPTEKLGFCREGFFASKIRNEPPRALVSRIAFRFSDLQSSREATLGYGIGAAQFPTLFRGDLKSEVDQLSYLSGLKYYFVDGIGMGLYASNRLDLNRAVSACRSFTHDIDKALCFFGMGRAAKFARNEIFNQQEFHFSERETFHLRQGFLFAKLYANREKLNESDLKEPGVLAAASGLPAAQSLPVKLISIEKACLTSISHHHYLCALQILRPEILFLFIY